MTCIPGIHHLTYMNRIDGLFAEKKDHILSVYYTAGYPRLNDTLEVLKSLQAHGADLVEIGMPFSDPLADGPVIQQSSVQALANGMSLDKLFIQLKDCRREIRLPLILMGYLNPVLQFGMERFVEHCADREIDGVILPDLPLKEYEKHYQSVFESSGLHMIFLITPETQAERIREIDQLSRGFIYMVSSSSTTGRDKDPAGLEAYYDRINRMKLNHPVLTGFGIRDKPSFERACRYSQGAIIGTAFIRALGGNQPVNEATGSFLGSILQQNQ